MANILPAPYRKGQWGVPPKADRLVHMWMALVFVALPVSNLVLTYIGSDRYFQMYGLIYIGIFGLALWIESLGKSKFPFLAIDVLLFVVTISGLVGIALQGFRAQYIYRDTVAFTIFLLMRNFTLFIMVPRSMVVDTTRLVKLAERWLFYGAMTQLVATFIFATSKGYFLVGKRFFESNWLHPNWIAVYGGLVLILVLIGKNLKKWEKITAVTLSVYMLLMMQSRAILVALFATYLVVYFIAIGRNKAKGLIMTVVGSAVATVLFLTIGPAIASFEPIANMIERSQDTDPTAGRLGAFERAVRIWEESPIFGYGYNAGFQMDNFLAKYGTETGLVGVVLYFAFLSALIYVSINTYKKTTNETVRYVSTLAIAFNTFVFFRSAVEATDIFHLSDLMSNAAFLWSGMVVAGANTLALQKKSVPTVVDRIVEQKQLSSSSKATPTSADS